MTDSLINTKRDRKIVESYFPRMCRIGSDVLLAYIDRVEQLEAALKALPCPMCLNCYPRKGMNCVCGGEGTALAAVERGWKG